MMRSRDSRYPVAAALLAVAAPWGCALDDGLPWGRLDPVVDARFVVPADRLQGDEVVTANGYAIRVAEVKLSFASLAVSVTPPGAAPAGFDPADPPEGYGLCHNGHCHADDGSLVPYAEIEAGLGGSAVSRELVLPIGISAPLRAEPATVAVTCAPKVCELDRGIVSAAQLRFDALQVTGRVFDRGPSGRVPASGVDIAIDVPLDADLLVPLRWPVDKDHRPGIAATFEVALSASVFDEFDWAAVADQAADLDALSTQLSETLVNHATLSAHATRFTP